MKIHSISLKVVAALLLSLLFVNCGGGSSSSNGSNNQKSAGGGGDTTTPENSWLNTDKSATRAQAITFLKQAAIAQNESDIAYVMQHGYAAWIDKQLGMPFDEKKSIVNLLYGTLSKLDGNYTAQMAHPADGSSCDKIATPKKYRLVSNSLWWQRAFRGADQLRQKVAYALSQIIVVSAVSPAGDLLEWRGEGLAYYYDILQRDAFSTYKKLLRDITYSPAMAYYMTYIGSAKYDPSKGESPDENYAREVMQMFSIGPSELRLDGTIETKNGRDIPTYTQDDVMEGARIFSGWSIAGNGRFDRIAKGGGCYLLPIEFYSQYHDTGAKRLLGYDIPADQNGTQDIEAELDILTQNKNMAPFIAKKLIQRLTTSNPSPAYVKRVASVFNDDGHGKKGDLGAVVRAILLDKEVRNGLNENRGRVDELLTSLAHLYSTFGVMPTHSWIFYGGKVPSNMPLYWAATKGIFAQAAMSAPDVFNFYDADYAPKDANFTNNHLIAPELQIQTSSNLIRYNNFITMILGSFDKYAILHIDKKYATLEEFMTQGLGKKGQAAPQLMYVDLTNVYETLEKAVDGDTNGDFAGLKDSVKQQKGAQVLVAYLDHKMLGDRLPKDYRDALVKYLANVGGYDNKLPYRARRIVVAAIVAIATSPYYMVIR